MPTTPEPLIFSLPEARRLVEEQARAMPPTPVITCGLGEARGLVVGEEVRADRDLPPFPRATRDGFAVRAADLARLPARLRVCGEVRAGSPVGQVQVRPGEAAEIMTGASVPPGADAVVMVEYTRREDDRVHIERKASAGENIVPTGSEARTGQALLEPGTRLGYAQIAVAAAVGKAQIQVHRRPRVAIVSTGDEIVEVAATPAVHQIRNSNRYSLSAQVRAAGGEPAPLAIAADDVPALRSIVAQGLDEDLLLLTGGVSAGKYDLVEAVLAEFGAQFFFTGALIQPGRPVVFGRARRPAGATRRGNGAEKSAAEFTWFLGLPGNPISTMVTFELFARPAIDALSGAPPAPLRFLKAWLREEIRVKTGLTRFLPARLSGSLDDVQVEPVRWQGSGDVAASARADCYIVVPPDRDKIMAGEMVSVLPR